MHSSAKQCDNSNCSLMERDHYGVFVSQHHSLAIISVGSLSLSLVVDYHFAHRRDRDVDRHCLHFSR